MMVLTWLPAIGTAFPLLYWSAECLAGLDPDPPCADTCHVPSFTVLIPAHDEAAGITRIIAGVRAQLRHQDRIVVVADNCNDDTPNISRAAGAEVVERHDSTRRGKAYALAAGRSFLRQNPSDVVIILDADCWPEPGALRRIARTADRYDAAVQGRYVLHAKGNAPPMVRVSTFAFLIKNGLRQRGLQRLGGTTLLQGTGMAFPWRMFDVAPLETSSLVEDLKLGLDLALSGERLRFEDHAHFVSGASTQRATVGQRTRWEHGMLATAGRYLPRLLWQGFRGEASLLFLAANLCVPPLLLLITLAMIVFAGLAIGSVATGSVGTPITVLIAGLAATATLFAVWCRHGRALLPAAVLPNLARYWAWKLPIYGRFLARRQREWVRTERI